MTHPRPYEEEPTRLPEPVVPPTEEPTKAQRSFHSDEAPTLAPTSVGAVGAKGKALSTGRIFGDYQILEEIARGGMGVVYRARQLSLNRLVALKMILAGQLASSEDVKRFYVEAESAAGLSHPGIVPIHEIGEQDGQHFFSMGYVEGPSLATVLKDGPLNPREAAYCLSRVCDAIQYAHDRGVIHRDLKPGNILLADDPQLSDDSSSRYRPSSSKSQNGKSHPSSAFRANGPESGDRIGGFIPKVTDFGLAQQIHSQSDLTGTGQVLGTPSYMPPEQADSKVSNIGPASDVYSLGAILYCMLTGRPPFQAANPVDTILQVMTEPPISPRQLNPSIPKDLETICLKCIEKPPAKRYSSASAISAELKRYLSGEPILARPISSLERGVRWLKHRPAMLAIGLVLGFAFAFIVTFTILANRRLQRERDIAVAAKNDAQNQRQLAQSRLDKAIQAVDQMMVRVATERWARKPELQEERRVVLEDAVRFYNAFIDDNERDPRVREEAAKSHKRVATIYLMMSELGLVVESTERSMKLYRDLMQEYPKQSDYSFQASEAISLMGKAYALTARYDESLKASESAIELAQAAVNMAPERAEYLLRLVESKSYYCYFCLAFDKSRASQTLKTLLAEAQAIGGNESDPWAHQLAYAFALTVQGAFHLADGKFGLAIDPYERSFAILERLKDQPATTPLLADQFLHTHAIVTVQCGLVRCLARQEEDIREQGLAMMMRGRQMFEELLVQNPKAFPYRLQLIQAIRGTGQALRRMGRQNESEKYEQEAQMMMTQLVQENPNITWLAGTDSFRLSAEWVAKVRGGELVGLKENAERLISSSTPSIKRDVIYNVACAYAIASTLDDSMKVEYADRAMAYLNELKKLRYFESEIRRTHLPKDDDLIPLRDRPDFSALLSELGL